MIDELTKAWAAGVFDGEGSALIEKVAEHSYLSPQYKKAQVKDQGLPKGTRTFLHWA